MTLDKFIKDYLDKGLLKRHKVDFDQIDKLITIAKEDLQSVRLLIEDHPSVAFNCAYSAMLQCVLGLLCL